MGQLAILATLCACALSGCGPWGPQGMIPGGPLVGPAATLPAAEACDHATLLAGLETRAGWLRSSVTVFCFAAGGELYVPSRNGGTKRWPRNVLADPRVRIEIGGAIHAGRLVRVREMHPDAGKVFVRKVAGVEAERAGFLLDTPSAEEDRADLWMFRFEEDPA